MTSSVQSGIDRAVDFLLGARQHGLWQDFVLAPGWSDEWVTGYTGTRVAGAVGIHPCLQESWALLRTRPRTRTAGWGYNILVPQDADSTSWVLRLASAVGEGDDPVCIEARASLDLFRHGDGMLGTYGPTDEIRRFIGAGPERSFVGWTSAHACVTAAAAGVPGVVQPEVLPRAQWDDGRWHSYWWEADAFATALAAEACLDEEARARAVTWARDRVARGADGLGSFELANLVAVLHLGSDGRDAIARAAVDQLLSQQESDGRWLPSARMRVPDPGDTTPDLRSDWREGGRIEGAVVQDNRAVFTTATALHALTLAQRSMSESQGAATGYDRPMSDQEYACHICNAVFAEEQALLDHFCPGPADGSV